MSNEIMRITYMNEEIETVYWSSYKYDEIFLTVYREDAYGQDEVCLIVPVLTIKRIDFLSGQELGHGL